LSAGETALDAAKSGGIEQLASPVPECRWFWALNGTVGQAHRAGVKTSGLDATLEDAKAAWRRSYDKWLAWVGRRDSDSTSA